MFEMHQKLSPFETSLNLVRLIPCAKENRTYIAPVNELPSVPALFGGASARRPTI